MDRFVCPFFQVSDEHCPVSSSLSADLRKRCSPGDVGSRLWQCMVRLHPLSYVNCFHLTRLGDSLKFSEIAIFVGSTYQGLLRSQPLEPAHMRRVARPRSDPHRTDEAAGDSHPGRGVPEDNILAESTVSFVHFLIVVSCIMFSPFVESHRGWTKFRTLQNPHAMDFVNEEGSVICCVHPPKSSRIQDGEILSAEEIVALVLDANTNNGLARLN